MLSWRSSGIKCNFMLVIAHNLTVGRGAVHLQLSGSSAQNGKCVIEKKHMYIFFSTKQGGSETKTFCDKFNMITSILFVMVLIILGHYYFCNVPD